MTLITLTSVYVNYHTFYVEMVETTKFTSHMCHECKTYIAAGNSIFYHSKFTPMHTSVIATHLCFNFKGAERTSFPEDQQSAL